jgi:hypothetical protein
MKSSRMRSFDPAGQLGQSKGELFDPEPLDRLGAEVSAFRNHSHAFTDCVRAAKRRIIRGVVTTVDLSSRTEEKPCLID